MTPNTKQLEQDGETFTLGAKRDTLRVQSLVGEYLGLMERIAKGEALLRELKEKAREMEWQKIPSAMTENGMTKVERSDGITVEVVSEITGSIPENRREEAVRWLRKNGHGGIIQSSLYLSFKKGQEDDLKRAREALNKRGFSPEERASVNHMTLKAWAREMVKSGTALPTELLGLFIGQRAKIKLPKEQ